MSEFAHIEKLIEAKQDKAIEACRKIWEYAELSHDEFQSAELLCSILEEEGFTVERGVCGQETAFVATYGSGKPVIGLLANTTPCPTSARRPV